MRKLKFLDKKLLKNKNFLLLWIGQLTSEIGNEILEFALSWYIFLETGSTLALSLSLISIYIPKAIISTFSGIIADRYNRKKIVVINDILSGVIILALFIVSTTTNITLLIVIIFNILTSSISAIFNPAMSGAVQSVLSDEELKDASALLQIEGNISGILGSAIAGFLLKIIGLKYLILLNAISFIISALLESLVELPKIQKKQEQFIVKNQYYEIIDFLNNNKIILFITLFAGIIANGVFMSISVYLPGIFKDVLNLSSVELGIFNSIAGITAVITSGIFIIYSNKKINAYNLTLISLVMEGIVFLLVSMIGNVVFAYITAIIYGLSSSMCSIASGIITKKLIPNNLMGRMGSFNILINSITMPLFTILYGGLGEYINLQKIIFISACIFFILLIPAPYIFKNEQNKSAIEY